MARPKRRRVSTAEMAREVARVEAEHEERRGRVLPAELAAVVAGYRSSTLGDQQVERVRPFMLEAITRSTLTGKESVRKHCTHLAAIGAFAVERGLPLTVEAILTTDTIDEYVRVGMSDDGKPLRAERRRRLLALAASVNPGPTVPARLTPIAHSAVQPCYTPAEDAVIKRVCLTQPTASRRRDLCCVVGLGRGAGLDSVDFRHLYVEHMEDRGDEGLLAHVQGPRPRIVQVRRTLEPLVRAGIEGRHRSELVIGVKADRRNTAARAVERGVLYNVPHIEPARLRATWFADLMTDTVPIGVILRAGGLKSARTLSELLPHLGPWIEHKNLAGDVSALLRGGAQ